MLDGPVSASRENGLRPRTLAATPAIVISRTIVDDNWACRYNVQTMASAVRSRKIDVRVTDAQDALIREAAAAAGQTVTAFLLGAAEDRARAILDQRRHLVIGDQAFAALVMTLDESGEPVTAISELLSLPRISSQ